MNQKNIPRADPMTVADEIGERIRTLDAQIDWDEQDLFGRIESVRLGEERLAHMRWLREQWLAVRNGCLSQVQEPRPTWASFSPAPSLEPMINKPFEGEGSGR